MQRVNMDNREYIIGIDIGSSNVTMAVGTRNEDGSVTVLGVEVQKVEACVKDGDVTNHILLGDAIAKAKSDLESYLELRLNSAYVGISGRSVYCVRYEDYVDINEKTCCVTDVEMRELNARIDAVAPKGADVIIDRIPLRYCIDDRQEVTNPLGSYGRKLSVEYLYVMTDRFQIERVNKALHRAGIRNCGLCISPTLLPELLLTPEEKEEGVAIVDIGGDLTDIAVVREGKLHYFSSLPIGSSSINNDLQAALNIPKKDVDVIKHRYGSAIAAGVREDIAISIKTVANRNRTPILQRNIAEVAEERLKDIAQFVSRELRAAKFSTRIPCGVVLTGGATYIANIDQLFARELGMEVRFGDMLNGVDDQSQEVVCARPQSVAIGLLLYGAKHQACDTFAPPTPLVEEVVKEGGLVVVDDQPIEVEGEEVETDKIGALPEHNTIEDTEVEHETEFETEEEVEQEEDNEEEETPKKKAKRGLFQKFIEWIDTKLEDDEYL